VIYKDIVDFPGYQVSDEGLVRRLCKSGKYKQLKLTVIDGGYQRVSLYKNGEKFNRCVHTLVLETFICKKPEGLEARHFPDKDPSNNRLYNLSWGTKKQNNLDKIFHGTNRPKHPNMVGIKHPQAKLKDADIVDIFRRKRSGQSIVDIGKHYHINHGHVYRILNRDVWSHVQIDEGENNAKSCT